MPIQWRAYPIENQGIRLSIPTADKEFMQERRSEVRMLCADLLEIRWKDRAGKSHRTQAVLEDISYSGACLQLEGPLPAGAIVWWRSPKKEFTGLVRYCVYREFGYFVGVEFDFASKWCRKTFRPQHLLDLERLIAARKRAETARR